jgi:hypothetical protein
VNVAPGITISGITVAGLNALSFGGGPNPSVPVAAPASITITISGGVTVSSWYIEVNSPAGSTPYTAASFTAPASPGFYSVNVIATVNGVDYSGSFGLTVE